MIGQTIVNVEMGKGEAAFQPCGGHRAADPGDGAQRRDGQNPDGGAGGHYGDCRRQNLQLAQPSARHGENGPDCRNGVMLVTVAATVSTGNLAIGVLGLSSWHSFPPALSVGLQQKNRRQPKKNKETAGIGDGGDHHARPHRGRAPVWSSSAG
jgi:SulP family sulfate permease